MHKRNHSHVGDSNVFNTNGYAFVALYSMFYVARAKVKLKFKFYV
nr:MAG TPA: hypothetical protein [Caudoviricetes sp.]